MDKQYERRERVNSDDNDETRAPGAARNGGVHSPKSIEMQPLTSGRPNGNNDTFEDEPGAKMEDGTKCNGEVVPEAPVIDGPWNLNDWLFPPHLPPELQLFRKENIAVPACYLLVGILQGLSGPLINVYPLDLNATEAQQTTISTLKSLPASLKLIFGFISDNFPILGYRRKSYMLIGWAMSALAFASLLLTCDLTLSEEDTVNDDGTTGTRTKIPPNAPSIPLFCLMTFLYGTGK